MQVIGKCPLKLGNKTVFLKLKHNSPPKGEDKVERIFKNIEKKHRDRKYERKKENIGRVSFIRTEMQDRK